MGDSIDTLLIAVLIIVVAHGYLRFCCEIRARNLRDEKRHAVLMAQLSTVLAEAKMATHALASWTKWEDQAAGIQKVFRCDHATDEKG